MTARTWSIQLVGASLLVLVLFGGSRLAHPAEPTVAAGGDASRVAVVLQLFDALNRGDAAAATALMSADATLISGSTCTLPAPCRGTAALRQANEGTVAANTTFSLLSVEQLGSTVVGRYEVRNPSISRSGTERLVESFIAQVPQGQVALFISLYDFTDPPTAALVTPR